MTQRMSWITAFSTLITLAYCGTAKVEGYDCPDASQLKAGVSLRCGGSEIVGTLDAAAALKACTIAGETECVSTGGFRAVAAAELLPEVIKAGASIGGVAGSYEAPAPAKAPESCTFDGEHDCVVSKPFAALSVEGIAVKIVAGQIVGGVSGIGVLNPPALCERNSQVGCLANADFPVIAAERLATCLAAP